MKKFAALSFVLAITACAWLNKVDLASPHTGPCPQQCGPTASFPQGGCCWNGDVMGQNGWACNGPLSKSADICSWQGVSGPTQDVPMWKTAQDAGPDALVPTTAPSPVEPPKEVSQVEHGGQG